MPSNAVVTRRCQTIEWCGQPSRTMAEEPERPRDHATTMMASHKAADERDTAARNSDRETGQDAIEGGDSGEEIPQSSEEAAPHLEDGEDDQITQNVKSEDIEIYAGVNATSEACADLDGNQDTGAENTSPSDDDTSDSASTQRSTGLQKVDKSVATKEKVKIARELPNTPRGYYFRLDSEIKWDLGKIIFIRKNYDRFVKRLADA